MTRAKIRLPSATVFAAALAIVGVLPAIPAPFPALSLDTVLGSGVYLVSMILLALLAVLADRQATREAATRESDREKAAAERHDAFVAIVKEQREEDRVQSDQDRIRLEAMFTKFERGLAADAKREELVAAGRPINHPTITALAHDASGAWHDVVQMYVQRQQYRSGTAAQLAAASQMQQSLDNPEVPRPPSKG